MTDLKSIIRVKPSKKLITNCGIDLYNADKIKKELKIAFPGQTFKIINYVKNINDFYPDELNDKKNK